MKNSSIIGKNSNTEEDLLGYFNAGGRAKFYGENGVFGSGLAGTFFSTALMFVSVVGHIFVLGPFAAMLKCSRC